MPCAKHTTVLQVKAVPGLAPGPHAQGAPLTVPLPVPAVGWGGGGGFDSFRSRVGSRSFLCLCQSFERSILFGVSGILVPSRGQDSLFPTEKRGLPNAAAGWERTLRVPPGAEGAQCLLAHKEMAAGTIALQPLADLGSPRLRHRAEVWPWQGPDPNQLQDREQLFVPTGQRPLLPPGGTRWPGLGKPLSPPGTTSRKQVAPVGAPVIPDELSCLK